MKIKNYLFILAISLFSSITNAQQEQIIFQFTDNSQQIFALDEVRKMDFTASQLRMHQLDGTILSWDFDFIDHYRYDIPTSTNEISSKLSVPVMSVFPNPASDVLNIQYEFLNKQDAELSIISLDGRVIEKRRLTSSQKGSLQVDLSYHPAGQYIVLMSCRNFNISRTVLKI
jgi:hypothetical protein